MMPLSIDLRERIINAYNNKEGSAKKLAERFSVSMSTVKRLISRYKKTGSIEPKPHGGGKPAAIGESGYEFLAKLFKEGLDLTLRETCQRYQEKFGVKISISMMDRALKKLNITRKKKTKYDPEKETQRVKELREDYLEAIGSSNPDDLRFIDEAGSTLNMDRNYSRSPEGERAVGLCPVASGERISTIGALSNQGMETALCFEGTLNGDLLLFFIEAFLVPTLRKGNIVIMDNCTAHHVEGVRELIEGAGARLLYLPPYSPELNPIEYAWSKVKNILRTIKARTKELLYDAISESLKTITWSNAQGWFDHANI
jgi:transposase